MTSESPTILKTTEDFFSEVLISTLSSATEEILLIAPYIKTDALKVLLSKCNVRTTLITTWRVRDLAIGASDINLYDFCKQNDISLFLHPRIHLKSFVIDWGKNVIGSMNISKKGLGLVENCNYELATIIEELSIADISFYKRIIKESVLVDDHIYSVYNNALEKAHSTKEIEEIDLSSLEKDPEFLISALPMSKDLDTLFGVYRGDVLGLDKEELHCAIHDLVQYDLPEGLDESQFFLTLSEDFFSAPFIVRLIDYIGVEGKFFGEVKAWIQRNCEDVPVPSRRELTDNIQILYQWIVRLSEGGFRVDIPGRHSEKIYRVK